MAIYWGPVASNGYTIYRDIHKVQVCSFLLFGHTGTSEAYG